VVVHLKVVGQHLGVCADAAATEADSSKHKAQQTTAGHGSRTRQQASDVAKGCVLVWCQHKNSNSGVPHAAPVHMSRDLCNIQQMWDSCSTACWQLNWDPIPLSSCTL
jgi:hypothetical protein